MPAPAVEALKALRDVFALMYWGSTLKLREDPRMTMAGAGRVCS